MSMPLNGVNGKSVNMMDFNKPKSIFDAKSEFMKQLEVYKLKAEIRPRKVNIMEAQDAYADKCLQVDACRIVVPSNYGVK